MKEDKIRERERWYFLLCESVVLLTTEEGKEKNTRMNKRDKGRERE